MLAPPPQGGGLRAVNVVNLYLMTTLMLGMSSFLLEAASNPFSKGKDVHSAPRETTLTPKDEQKESDLIERDEIDNTDVLAIPFDDSEIEDEQEINQGEKKEVFSLPHSR